MKSLLWINHYAKTPLDSGGNRHFELARELVKGGWDVTIAATDFDTHQRRYTRRGTSDDRGVVAEQVDGVKFLWFWSAPHTANDWRRGWNWVTFERSLTAYGDWSPRPDVVIGSSPQLFAATAGRRVARRLGVPFVFEIRDIWPESLIAAGGRKGPVYLVFSAVASRLYRTSRDFIVLSRGSVEFLQQRGIDPARVHFVPNGVDLSQFGRRPDAAAGGDFRVVYAGAHGPANGLDAVLDAAALLSRGGGPSVRFKLIGDGPAKAALQERARVEGIDTVEFADPVPKSEVPALLQAADAGLMVLRDSHLFSYGVSPNKLFDYFAAELPVICNVSGEVEGILRDARAGVQAADSSGAALAEAVERLARESADSRRALGRRGRDWVALHRDRSRIAGHLREMLEAITG